jgi:predicted alpha/beta hydrolase family esterase
MFRVFLILILVGCHSNCWASDELRELEYTEKIEASFSASSIGKIVRLQIEKKKFLALYTETEEKENSGTAIILHSMGKHPDHATLIKPLRTYLPQHNWATLSLQLPVLSLSDKQKDYYPLFDAANARIQAGIDFLVSAKVKNIVLIGDGLGGMMAAYYLKKNADNINVQAIVAVSLNVPDSEKDQAQTLDFIDKIDLPFLDIFAEYDVTEVTSTARKRRISGKNNSSYRQFKIKGEGHKKQHDEGLVVKRIYSWINWTFKK